MYYLDSGILKNYWGMSGAIDVLIDMLNKNRVNALSNLLSSNEEIETKLDERISLRQLTGNEITDQSFYSFAIQTGYLTYDLLEINDEDGVSQYKVKIPNLELKSVWKSFILNNVVRTDVENVLQDIFNEISDTDTFSRRFQEFISYQLSYHDLDEELEKIYHVLVFGLVLGAGFKCSSNKESGLGRYDIRLESADFNVIIEFKKAKKESDKLEDLASQAIKQIDDRKYYAKFPNNIPLYKIGVACYKTECIVTTVLNKF
jgi:hypothetical protein